MPGMIEIAMAYRETGVGKILSNLYPHDFFLDGVMCGSMEGFLQAIKLPDRESRVLMADFSGYDAWKLGQMGNSWKDNQVLYWDDKEFKRNSKAYLDLITRAYDACFEQNPKFVQAIMDSKNAILTHHMGKTDPRDSVLTQTEYIFQIYRLRAIVQQAMQ